MKIFIRADGGETIGLGHIMRTLVLAKELEKNNLVTYVCLDEKQFSKGAELVLQMGIPVIKIKEEKDILMYSGDIIIVDKYKLQEEYYKDLKATFTKVVSIDDNCELDYYYSDIIINQNIYASELTYKSSTETKLLLGSNYVMMRNEFREKKAITVKENIEDILITLGGSDANNITEILIKELLHSRYKLHIIVGNAFTNYEDLKKYSSENIELYRNAKMSEVMSKCDLAITAYGSTIYELCYMGIPSLGIEVADNQKRLKETLNENGIIVELRFGSILEQIQNLDYKKRMRLSFSMSKLVDGKGIKRIISQLN